MREWLNLLLFVDVDLDLVDDIIQLIVT